MLLEKLDHPERRLPPVVHVAGTNGKGSTCAFVRAMAETAGQRVHVYTSPHLVRFNERIRVAGELVSDAALAAALEHVEQVNAGAAITVFEVITAVAFHLFAQTRADLCVLEVGLGGRGDATNVIDRPAACAITSISLDHREMLGDTLTLIAAEKAGIMKRGVQVAIGAQPPEVTDLLLTAAQRVGAPVMLRDRDWRIAPGRYDDTRGALELPPPSLPGAFQLDNAGIAIAAMRASGLAMDRHGRRSRGVAGAAAAPARQAGCAVAGGLGAVARRRTQSRRRRRAGGASANMVGSAGACGCRHETDEGCRRVPPAIGSICNHLVGGSRTRSARCTNCRGDH